MNVGTGTADADGATGAYSTGAASPELLTFPTASTFGLALTSLTIVSSGIGAVSESSFAFSSTTSSDAFSFSINKNQFAC